MHEKLAPVHPGEILSEEFLRPMGITQYRLAKEISVAPRRINEIVHGQRSMSADTALRLAKFFGTSDIFWLNLQARYDLDRQRQRLGNRLRESQPSARLYMKKEVLQDCANHDSVFRCRVVCSVTDAPARTSVWRSEVVGERNNSGGLVPACSWGAFAASNTFCDRASDELSFNPLRGRVNSTPLNRGNTKVVCFINCRPSLHLSAMFTPSSI